MYDLSIEEHDARAAQNEMAMVYVHFLLVRRLQIQVDSNTALAGSKGATITNRTRVQARCREILTEVTVATVLRSRSKEPKLRSYGPVIALQSSLMKQSLY